MAVYVVVYKYLDPSRGERVLQLFLTRVAAERYMAIQQEHVNPKIGTLEVCEMFPIDGVEKLYYIVPTCLYED